jgi:hypothetical protein
VIRAKIAVGQQGIIKRRYRRPPDTPRQIVSKWRQRFCIQRLSGLEEQPRAGDPPAFPPM